MTIIIHFLLLTILGQSTLIMSLDFVLFKRQFRAIFHRLTKQGQNHATLPLRVRVIYFSPLVRLLTAMVYFLQKTWYLLNTAVIMDLNGPLNTQTTNIHNIFFFLLLPLLVLEMHSWGDSDDDHTNDSSNDNSNTSMKFVAAPVCRKKCLRNLGWGGGGGIPSRRLGILQSGKTEDLAL